MVGTRYTRVAEVRKPKRKGNTFVEHKKRLAIVEWKRWRDLIDALLGTEGQKILGAFYWLAKTA